MPLHLAENVFSEKNNYVTNSVLKLHIHYKFITTQMIKVDLLATVAWLWDVTDKTTTTNKQQQKKEDGYYRHC